MSTKHCEFVTIAQRVEQGEYGIPLPVVKHGDIYELSSSGESKIYRYYYHAVRDSKEFRQQCAGENYSMNTVVLPVTADEEVNINTYILPEDWIPPHLRHSRMAFEFFKRIHGDIDLYLPFLSTGQKLTSQERDHLAISIFSGEIGLRVAISMY